MTEYERWLCMREQQVKLIHGTLVTYYADHAVKELRVTEIEIL